VLIEQIGFGNYCCQEIDVTQSIHDILSLSTRGLTATRSGGGGGKDGMIGDGGPAGPSGSRSGTKRKMTQASGSATKKTPKKARAVAVQDSGFKSNDEGSELPPNRVECLLDCFK
jgi:hypothetical protein